MEDFRRTGENPSSKDFPLADGRNGHGAGHLGPDTARSASAGGDTDFWLYGQAAALAQPLPAGTVVLRRIAGTAAALRDLGREAQAWTLD